MRTERIIWGLIFLFVGGVLLLDNFDVINFHWSVLWRFWPIIPIVLGVNMVLPQDDVNRSGMIAVVLTVASLAFIGYQGTLPSTKHHTFKFKYEDDLDFDEDETDSDEKVKDFNAPMSETAKYATLNIEGGATHFILKDTTAELFEAKVNNRGGHYSLFKTAHDNTEKLDFAMNEKTGFRSRGSGGGKAYMKLNTRPVWDVNIDVGAGKVDLDLSPYKVKNLNLNGGAASFKMRFGMPVGTSSINTDTGVSKLVISIPKGAACRITTDTGLSSNDFDGFNKMDDGNYETPGFDKAVDKFIISIDGGLSSARVDRY